MLAVSGDQTVHVLWRLQNGEGPRGLKPAKVALMIGTNDVSHLSYLQRVSLRSECQGKRGAPAPQLAASAPCCRHPAARPAAPNGSVRHRFTAAIPSDAGLGQGGSAGGPARCLCYGALLLTAAHPPTALQLNTTQVGHIVCLGVQQVVRELQRQAPQGEKRRGGALRRQRLQGQGRVWSLPRL